MCIRDRNYTVHVSNSIFVLIRKRRFLSLIHICNVGTPGCVSFMFDKKGQIVIDKEEYEGDADELMMQVLDAGAEDFVEEEDLSLIHI